jgi:transcription elongation factor GreA
MKLLAVLRQSPVLSCLALFATRATREAKFAGTRANLLYWTCRVIFPQGPWVQHCFDTSNMTDIAEKIKKKLKDEIAALEHELHSELPKEIKVARAHGDLSENAEYKYAKERQAYVSARLGQLHQRMADISLMNLNNLPKDRAAYGSRIVVLDVAKDAEIEYKLVTVEEADAAKGLISTSSPIGRALLGKKVGDEVKVATPAGVKEYEVVRLSTIHDED